MPKLNRWIWLLLIFACIALTAKAMAQCLVPYPASEKVLGISSVTLYGKVTDETASDLIAQIQAANKEKTDKPIILYINSGGGSVLAGGLILDAMEASRRPIITVCTSVCASMAAYIAEHGAKRLMFSHAILMFHEMSAGTEGDLGHMQSMVAVLVRLSARYEKETALLAQLTEIEYRAHIAANWWLLADEAVAAHLADGLFVASDYPTK